MDARKRKVMKTLKSTKRCDAVPEKVKSQICTTA